MPNDRTASNSEISDFLTQSMGDDSGGRADLSDDNAEDFGVGKSEKSVPNASIRLEKLKRQRDQVKLDNARLQGELDALRRGQQSPQQDELENLTPEQRRIMQLEAEVEKQKADRKIQRVDANERDFFSRNPELASQKEEVVEELGGYFRSKPSQWNAVLNGEITIDEAWAAYQATLSKPRRNAQNPDSVFGGNKRMPQNEVDETDNDNFDKAGRYVQNTPSYDRDRRTHNKAVSAMEAAIMGDIHRAINNQGG